MTKSNCNLKSNNMQEIVFRSNDNQALTTSVIVAEKFGKEHKHVLEAIRNILSTTAQKSAFVDNQQLAKMFALAEVELIAFPAGGMESSIKKNIETLTDIRIFENVEFGKIRTAGTGDKPLFCLADVCKILEINNSSDVKNRLKTDGVVLIEVIDSLGRTQKAVFIDERNLYKVIMRSDKPQAEAFQDWVCGDVLPSIRKTGVYALPKTFAQALRLAAEQQEMIEAQQKQLEMQKPKVEFFEAVAESKTAIDIKAAANTLHFKNIGRNKLFEILRNAKILMWNNLPYQKYVDCGYFRTIEQKYTTHDGVKISIKTLVYQKGMDFIRRTLNNLGYKQVEQ